MSGTVLKTTITVVLLFHGIGQLMGVLPVFHLFGTDTGNQPKWAKSWSARSGVVNGFIGEKAGRILCFALYFSAFVIFVAAAFSLQGWIFPGALWKTLAVLGAMVSLAAITLFWNGLIMLFPHKIGNIVVNLIVLIALLVKKWPSDSLMQ